MAISFFLLPCSIILYVHRNENPLVHFKKSCSKMFVCFLCADAFSVAKDMAGMLE